MPPISEGQLHSKMGTLEAMGKRVPNFTGPLKNQEVATFTSHEIHQVDHAKILQEQDGSTTPPSNDSLSSEKEIDSIVHTFSTPADRVYILNEVTKCAKVVVQHALDASNATIDFDSVFRLVIDGRRDDKRGQPIAEASCDVRIARDVIEASLKSIESRLLQSELDSDNPAELATQDEMLLVRLNLGIIALKEAMEQLNVAAEFSMDDVRYRGEIANQALAPLRALVKNQDSLFEKAIAMTRSLPMKAPVFSSLSAKKEALQQLLQHAEKAKSYATDLMDGPAEKFHDTLDGILDNDTADEQLDQLSEAEGEVLSAVAIATVAITNAKEHLYQWEAAADEKGPPPSSEEAFLFASLEMTTLALEEAAKQIVTATEPMEGYKKTWYFTERAEEIATNLEAIKTTYSNYKMS